MVARIAWLPSLGTWTLQGSGDPFDPTSGKMVFGRGTPTASPISEAARAEDSPQPEPSSHEMEMFLECASLCNIASVYQEPADQSSEKAHEKKGHADTVWAARGDPTEM